MKTKSGIPSSKVALITRAGSGIGASGSILLAPRGTSVALIGRKIAKLDSIRRHIEKIKAQLFQSRQMSPTQKV